VRARPFVVRTTQGHQLLQTRFVEHDDVIETLATRGSNESLDKCILPRRMRGCEYFLGKMAFARPRKSYRETYSFFTAADTSIVHPSWVVSMSGIVSPSLSGRFKPLNTMCRPFGFIEMLS
jgi:hypothetical protein